ncbi:MAG: hypothetical protein Q7S00_00445 [bacterium]|nr:hypothetical protein [bacterium]
MVVELNRLRPELQPAPPADFTIDEQTLKKLGLPEDIRKDTLLISSFLRRQQTRMNELEFRPSMKVESGAIPSPEEVGLNPRASSFEEALSEEERAALADWLGNGPVIGLSSEELICQSDGLVMELSSNPPAPLDPSDPLAQMGNFDFNQIVLTSELQQEWNKKEKEWQELISTLMTRGGDATTLLLAIAGMVTDKYTMGLRSTITVLQTNESQRRSLADQFTQQMNLGGTGSDLTSLTFFQNQQQTMMTNTQMLNQKLQVLMQDRDRYQNITKEMLQSIHQALQHISGRLPGGAG